jgi:hypothetical protein
MYSENMYSVLNCHNVAKSTEFYLGQLRFNAISTGKCMVFKKKSFTMLFQMLLCGECYQKRLHLKAHKLSIVQWNTFVKLFFKHPAVHISVTI